MLQSQQNRESTYETYYADYDRWIDRIDLDQQELAQPYDPEATYAALVANVPFSDQELARIFDIENKGKELAALRRSDSSDEFEAPGAYQKNRSEQDEKRIAANIERYRDVIESAERQEISLGEFAVYTR